MPDTTSSPNYPDVLGYITGGQRCNVNVAQLALAVRPRVVRAGRPFEAVLLVQNASDVNVDITATLTVPDQDARKQKGRFLSKKNHLLVGVRPAEVGYVVLPLTSLPDTAVHDSYKIAMEVSVKPLKKPTRIRLPEGGAEVATAYLREDSNASIQEMKKLLWSTSKRFGLRDVLEASFGLLPGRLGQIVDFQPGWVNLWHMSDFFDERLMIDQYGALMLNGVLPRLKKEFTLDLLTDATSQHFKAIGYKLQPLEALFIAKLLALVLEMAAPGEETFDYLGHYIFNAAQTLRRAASEDDRRAPLPRWCSRVLREITKDERLANTPAETVCEKAYDELLQDAIPHAFRMIRTVSGEEFGTEDEIEDYAARMVEMLHQARSMDFTHAYMPLIIGGIIIHDRMIGANEDISASLRGMHDVLKMREPEMTDSNDVIFMLTKQMVNRSLQKFGYQI